MYACDYLENGVLNVLRGVTFAAPAKVYLALYLNDPGEDGASGTEVSYAGYKRIEIDFSSPADLGTDYRPELRRDRVQPSLYGVGHLDTFGHLLGLLVRRARVYQGPCRVGGDQERIYADDCRGRYRGGD